MRNASTRRSRAFPTLRPLFTRHRRRRAAVESLEGRRLLTIAFESPTLVSTLRPAAAVAIGDLNEDLIPDLVVAEPLANTAEVKLGLGGGHFDFGRPIFMGSPPAMIALADMTGDGHLDLVTASTVSPSVNILMGDGHSNFINALPRASLFIAPSSMVVTDLNGDNAPDVALALRNVGLVQMMLNDGNGRLLSAATYAISGPGVAIAAGELNRDGFADLAIATQAGTVDVLSSIPFSNGQFSRQTYPAGVRLNGIVVADLDGDLADDVAVTDATLGTVNVLLNDGFGGLGGGTTAYSAGLAPQAIGAADVDGDGLVDLLAADAAQATLLALPGVGHGQFGSSLGFPTGPGPIALAVTDVTGDLRPDVVTVDQGNGTLSLLINSSGQTTLPPTLSIGDVTVDESVGFATFTVTRTGDDLSGTTDVEVTSADVSAVAGDDYKPPFPPQLHFEPGEAVKEVRISIGDDRVQELTETFELNLRNALGATIADGQAIGTIVDNDPPTLSISDATVNEAGGVATFKVVRLGVDLSGTADVYWSTADGSAAAPDDYVAVTPTLLHFDAGEFSKLIAVPIVDDRVQELRESFTVTLGHAAGAAVLDGEGVATILDDDPPAVSIDDVTVSEAAGVATFRVHRTGIDLGAPSEMYWRTDDGSAVAPGDYGAVAPTLLRFEAGETDKQVSVAIVNDRVQERSESFGVTLSPGTNATFSDARAIGTILDDEPRIIATGRTNLVAPKDKAKPKYVFSGVVASFASVDFTTGSSYKITVRWGDGSSSAADAVLNATTGLWDVVASHGYEKKGTYAVTVDILDANRASGSATSTVVAG